MSTDERAALIREAGELERRAADLRCEAAIIEADEYWAAGGRTAALTALHDGGLDDEFLHRFCMRRSLTSEDAAAAVAVAANNWRLGAMQNEPGA